MTTPATEWRSLCLVHGAADLFPMMDENDLIALGKDIALHGQKLAIIRWRDPAQPDKVYVLDGRNRFAAMVMNGVAVGGMKFAELPIEDPFAYAISANLRRRHIETPRQRAELIAKILALKKASQNDSDTVSRSFNPTPGKAGGSTADPGFAAAVEVGAQLGVGKRTIQRDRQALGISKSQSARKPKAGWSPEQIENARQANKRAAERKAAKGPRESKKARRLRLQERANERSRVERVAKEQEQARHDEAVNYVDSLRELDDAIETCVKTWPTPTRECLPRMLRELARTIEAEPVGATTDEADDEDRRPTA